MWARSVRLSALLIASALLTGCGSADDPLVGPGLGTLAQDEARVVYSSAGVDAAPLRGRLTVLENGCFIWSGEGADGAWIVWPDAAALNDTDGLGVVLDGGREARDGDALAVEGAPVALADLPDGANPDSLFGSFGGFCEAQTRGVLVLVDAMRADHD